jgi:hypothetical protein
MGVRVCGQFADGLFQAALFSAVFFNPERAHVRRPGAAGFATLLLPYSVVGPSRRVPRPVASAAGAARWQPRPAALVVVFATLLAVLGPTSPPVVAPRPARRCR